MNGENVLKVSQEYNIPVSIILAFAHNESHFGTKGRAVATNNPMNVGNTDYGDYKPVVCGVANNCLASIEDGLKVFAILLKNKYFYENEKPTLEILIERDFKAVRGDIKNKRYMTDKNAAQKYKQRLKDLEKFNIDF
jgi:hypothetical protein